jgi:hypothetical protein
MLRMRWWLGVEFPKYFGCLCQDLWHLSGPLGTNNRFRKTPNGSNSCAMSKLGLVPTLMFVNTNGPLTILNFKSGIFPWLKSCKLSYQSCLTLLQRQLHDDSPQTSFLITLLGGSCLDKQLDSSSALRPANFNRHK